MSDALATEFDEILPVLAENDEIRASVLSLIASEPIDGKALEGGNRIARFRDLLSELVNGTFSLNQAISNVNVYIPRTTSTHNGNNRVFPSGWEERLVRIQLSRFYNQAVMKKLMDEGETECFVPHSSVEQRVSECTSQLAGHNQDLSRLYSLLTKAYGDGDYSDRSPKIPNHPHCTHVVTRVS